MAAVLDNPGRPDYLEQLQRAETEIDNLRAAFGWSLEAGDTEMALRLASSLFPVWQDGGRNGEGLAWMKAALGQPDTALSVDAMAHTRALVDKSMLAAWTLLSDSLDDAGRALTLARGLADTELLIRALIACGVMTAYDPDVSRPYFTEAHDLAQGLDDPWIWSQLYVEEARSAMGAGSPAACEEAAERAFKVARLIGNQTTIRTCYWARGWARAWQGRRRTPSGRIRLLTLPQTNRVRL